MMRRHRCYSELRQLQTFEDRFKYLKLGGEVGAETFGFDRYLNQILYKTSAWKKARREVIIRDNGCDLGIEGHDIHSHLIVHHMNPITIEDINSGNEDVFNPEFLICVSHNTHNAIHYGDEKQLPSPWAERRPGDTCEWK